MFIYYTARGESGEFLQQVLVRHGAASRILRTPNGKPYLEQGECEFSLTHTEGLIAVAVGGQRVGLDAECRKPRKIEALRSRLTAAEREEDFFELWTAKEAYVKYVGGTLAEYLPVLEYKKGALFYREAPIDVQLRHFELNGCTLCLCTEREEQVELIPL